MLIFGSAKCIEFLPMNINTDKLLIYNLTSSSERFPRVVIMPPNTLQSDNFDQLLFDYIYGNDFVFIEWMEKIVMPLYYNIPVYLVINDNQVFDFITDSVSSIMRKRYGYNSYILNDPDDVLFLSDEVNKIGEFGILEMKYLYEDKERFSYLHELYKPGAGQ